MQILITALSMLRNIVFDYIHSQIHFFPTIWNFLLNLIILNHIFAKFLCAFQGLPSMLARAISAILCLLSKNLLSLRLCLYYYRIYHPFLMWLVEVVALETITLDDKDKHVALRPECNQMSMKVVIVCCFTCLAKKLFLQFYHSKFTNLCTI